MYCPSCGAINTTDQRFCRSCGLNLEPAAESLLAQVPGSGTSGLDRRQRSIEKFGQIAFGGFIVVVGLAVIGLIIAILDRMVFSGDRPWVGILLMAFLIFAALTLAYVFLREDLKEKRKAARAIGPPQHEDLEMPAVTSRLLEEREFEPVPNVTEHTTELLPQKKSDG